MNTRTGLPVQALPDGEAEVAVILRLTWEDVAALGREASRLAARFKRPVGLDEAASHRLRGRPALGQGSPERAEPAGRQDRPPEGAEPAGRQDRPERAVPGSRAERPEPGARPAAGLNGTGRPGVVPPPPPPSPAAARE
ncbi:hypothetical protein [Streptomyces sp. JJ36]|uniref:hypothetical protein n=1 Tax=Streptomyces sp. JJ36 TaxID=2736645 RepID=UPI001F41B1CA|nr:hypothetical protein [Streptomyces sp. JJ36]